MYYRSVPKRKSDGPDINLHALKRVIPDLDTGVERPLQKWLTNVRSSLAQSPEQQQADVAEVQPFTVFPLFDAHSVLEPPSVAPALPFQDTLDAIEYQAQTLGRKDFQIETIDPPLNCGTDLMRVRHGDNCPSCQSGTLRATQAIELGHTFHLGSRYSQPLGAVVNPPGGVNAAGVAEPMPVSTGCHGIGISRMIGAMAAILKDEVSCGPISPDQVKPLLAPLVVERLLFKVHCADILLADWLKLA